MERLKVSYDDRHELLLEIMDHPGLPLLMTQLDRCAQAMELDVLKFSLSPSPESEKMFLSLKHRAEGARKLFSIFNSHIEKLKKQPEAIE